MPGVANTPGFTHQFSCVGPSFLNDIALIIDTHACLFSFFVLDTLFPTREAFGQVLGNIANDMRLTDSLNIHNVGDAMPRRAPGFFEYLMRDEVCPFDQQMPMKAVLFKIAMPFQHSKVLYEVGQSRPDMVWPFPFRPTA